MIGITNAQTIEELLDRSAMSGNPLGQEPANLFTAEEKLLLYDYFEDNNTTNLLENRAIGDVYAVSIYGACTRGLGTFPLQGNYNLNFITNTTTKFYAGDWDDAGNLYGVVSDMMDENYTLVKINPSNGAETVIGSLGNIEPSNLPTGLAWNDVNKTMYALSCSSGHTNLYTIDLSTGTMTLIGETGNTLGIWLVIDNLGNAFMFDVGTDYLYSVNLTTGNSTTIGASGVDLSRAQDADFDIATGKLYAAGYLNGGVCRIYSVNTTTGQFTNLGAVNENCAQIGLFAIKNATVQISENSIEKFSFYPNPSSDIIYMQSAKNIECVSIYNVFGQEVFTTNVLTAEFSSVDVSHLSSGTYILKVIIDGQIGTYKIIKN